ncbi:hypothetical protein L211DRAFT_253174 [Terfezia boudieri ATCC MYA-4762]|uniref:Uncharacterized protein n=1 Tax=Terfezia boudieri ATCC MYA-4762 TaxID=1051890 RepID=A0A3N4MLK9_9PEZI|nr:hypothetical protein L211DRAFT_253174 [Terfezia boudieri ATCC MYA-4762]
MGLFCAQGSNLSISNHLPISEQPINSHVDKPCKSPEPRHLAGKRTAPRCSQQGYPRGHTITIFFEVFNPSCLPHTITTSTGHWPTIAVGTPTPRTRRMQCRYPIITPKKVSSTFGTSCRSDLVEYWDLADTGNRTASTETISPHYYHHHQYRNYNIHGSGHNS